MTSQVMWLVQPSSLYVLAWPCNVHCTMDFWGPCTLSVPDHCNHKPPLQPMCCLCCRDAPQAKHHMAQVGSCSGRNLPLPSMEVLCTTARIPLHKRQRCSAECCSTAAVRLKLSLWQQRQHSSCCRHCTHAVVQTCA